MYKFSLTKEQIYKALYEQAQKDSRFKNVPQPISRVEVKLDLDKTEKGIEIKGADLFIS